MLFFLKANIRWLAGGFLLLFASAFGQTFFIALSGGEIRAAFGLTHGAFGGLYMAVTLAAAFCLAWIGPVVDRRPVRQVLLFTLPLLALGALGLGLAQSLWFFLPALFLLRFAGQGMLVHIAYTALGRWFASGRGRAISISALGLNTAQAVLPLAFVALAVWLGWRDIWLLAAVVLLLAVLPLAWTLTRVERDPQHGMAAGTQPQAVRDWTRGQVLRDPVFYVLLLGMLPPAFISNTVFFHQVHLSELRGWGPEVFAAAFPVYAMVTVANLLLAGQLVDRLSARALLPFYLIPFGLGLVLLSLVDAPWSAYGFMALYGVSDGFSLALFGALWPEVYGTRYLGAIRGGIVAMMVLASALGPGLSGALIDLGLGFPGQLAGLGAYCLIVTLPLLAARAKLMRRLSPAGRA